MEYSLAELSAAITKAKTANDAIAVEELINLYDVTYDNIYGGAEEDSGFIENVLSGLGAGAVGMYESAALGGAALLEEENELKARDKIKSVAESLRPEGGDKEALSYKLASGIGSIGALLPTAFLGPAALPVAGVIAGGAGAGEASERAREFGATEEERNAATLRGAAIGLTEIAPLGRIAKGLQIPGVQKVLDKLGPQAISGIGSRVRSAAATGVTEGAQEAAAAILQNLNARGYDAEAELIDAGVLDEATIGGGAGAIIQAFADTIAGRRGGRSVSTEGVEEVDDKSDEQAIEEVFGLPALPKTVDIPMPDGSLRENVPIDDPEAQAFLRAQKMQSEAETGQFKAEQGTAARRKTELEAVREAQGRDQGLASLVKDDAAEQARRQTGDLFPLEKATAEREAARVAARGPEGMTDAEVDDALAEQAAEEERVARLEDDDQIKEQPDMVARAEDEQIRDMEETAEIETLLAEDEAQAARDAEEKLAIEQEYSALFGGTLDVSEAEARDAAIADENRAALSELEAQVKERSPKETQQQQPLGGMQSKTAAKKQGVTRRAAETGDSDGFTTATDAGRSGSGPQSSSAVVAGRETPEGARSATPTDATGLDSTVSGPAATGKRKRPKPRTLENGTAATALKLLEGKPVAPKPVAVPVDTSSVETEAPADIGGDIEFPTAVPRGTEFTNPDDVTALTDLVTKPIPRDQKGMELTAQTYIKRFKRPADAFEAIAFEIAENTPKFREQKGTSTSEKAKFAGTGGANTKATLQWIEQNLSPDAKAEIDRRIVEQQKKSTDVEKDTKARATQERDDTKVKQRETKIAQDVDTATDGKAKVVGTSTPSKATSKAEPSPTARADAATKKKASGATKKEDIVKEAVERVQGRKGKNATAPLSDDMSPAQVSAKIKADTAQFIEGGGSVDVLNLELDPKVAVELSESLPKDVKELLKKGDLKGALQSLAKSTKSKRVKQIARALSENTGTTKIELANEASLKDKGYEIGDKGDVAGLFDPKTNTILLNSNMPLTVHGLLHEATHAATINVLKNPSHPMTKQLNKLYADVKSELNTAYGAENLNEFVAEAFSNPTFQRKLASINPKGDDINGLQRFFRAVTNYVRKLIGMDTKPVGSALDAADAAIIEILSPSMSTSDSAVMNMVSTPDGVKKVLNDMSEIQKSLSSGSKGKFVDGAIEFFGDAGGWGKGKEVLMKLTGSQALGDIARGVGFKQLGLDLHAMYETMRGDMQKADELIQKTIDSYDNWAKGPKGIAGKEALDRLVYDPNYGATIYQVDPTKPRADYKGKTDTSGNKLEEIWDAQRKDWKILGGKGQGIFNEQRAEYKRLHEELKKVINMEIDGLESSDTDPANVKAFKEKKAKLKKQINERLIAAGELEVYFPLVRKGKYKLSFVTKVDNGDGTFREEPVFLMYDRKVDRDNMYAEVNGANTTVGKPDRYDGSNTRDSFKNAPSGSFVSDVLSVVAASGADKDSQMQEQIMRLFVESLPETSFAKSLQKRKGIAGFDTDVRAAMNTKGYDLSSQVEKMKSSAKIRMKEKEILAVHEAGAPKGVNEDTFNRVKDELLERAKFARVGAQNKDTEQWYQRSNQVAFLYTIGFNASSALVNLSQIPLVVGPFLSGKFGVNETRVALAKASKFVGASSISIVDYYDIKDGVFTLKPSQEKKIRETSSSKAEADAKIKEFKRMIPMVKMADDRGHIKHSEIKDQLRVGDRSSKNPALQMLDMVTAGSAWMFSTAERFNRQTSLATSYTLVLDKMDALDKAGKGKYYSALNGEFIDVPSDSETRMNLAAEEAMYLTQELNGGAVLETTIGYSQQGLGRVALMYKSYGLQMYYTMLKSGKMFTDNVGGKDAESKELAAMAFKQLVAVHLSALFFAGVQGLPLYGAASMIADMFLDDEEDDARTLTRKHLGEGWYKGAVTKLTGVDVASRVSLTNLFLQENRFNKDPSLEESLGFYLGGPALSTGNRLYRAVNDFTSGDYGSMERGMENLAPAGITNAWRSTFGRYQREGGIRSRRKDPIYDDMTQGDFAAQALGFPPAEYTRRQEISMRNKGVEKAVTSKRSAMTKKFYIAQRMGDHEIMREVMDNITAHNRRHPTAKVDPVQLMKSVNSHMDTSVNMHNGVTVNPIMQHAIMMSNREYRK